MVAATGTIASQPLPRTAGTHVANLLANLGVANRREAAAVAVQHGLV